MLYNEYANSEIATRGCSRREMEGNFMNFKKIISAVSAFAMVVTAMAGLAVTASAAETVVLNEAFNSTSVTNPGDSSYTWGTELTPNLTETGLKLTNSDNKNGNYSGRRLVAFANPVGDTNNTATINYKVAKQSSNVSKGQAYTYYTTSYYDNANNLIFSISEDVGLWANKSTLTYTTETGPVSVQLGTHIEGSVAINLVFNATGGFLTIDSQTYGFVSSSGISYVDLAVSGERDYSRGILISDYKVATEEANPTALVTINYTDEDGEKIPAESLPEGTALSAVVNIGDSYTPSYTSIFDDDLYRYTYISGGDSITNVQESTTITLVYGKAALIDYTITVNAAGELNEVITEVPVKQYKTVQYAFPQFIVKDGVAYQTPNNSTNPYYGGSVGNVTENGSVNVPYTRAYDNVAFFVDLDDTNGDNADIRASNRSAYCNKAYTSAEEIQPGTYDFIIRIQNKGRTSSIKVGDQVIFDFATYESRNSWNNVTISDVEISQAGQINFAAGGSKTYDCVDTILVIKKDIAPVEIVADEIPVDMSGVTTNADAKAYKIADFAMNGAAPVWTVNASLNGTDKAITATAAVPQLEGTASLGLVLSNIGEAVINSVTLGYAAE